MRIIISPAKKMNVDTDSLQWIDYPVFLYETEKIHNVLKDMSYDELKELWKCNEKIAKLNEDRLKTYDLRHNLTPAILSYEGIQYQYMAPAVFTDKELEYIQENLRILSGFYGVLRPFDGVIPYRLEMQAKLSVDGSKDLYAFWDNKIAKEVFKGEDCVINLASKEYSICVSKHIPKGIPFITCVFGEEKDGKVIEKGTICKMARGEMVRFMAENNIQNPQDIKAFNRLGFLYSDRYSGENKYVFILNN